MEGKVFLSTTVIEVFLYSGFLQRAQAVDSPKAPLPMIRTDEGVSLGAITRRIGNTGSTGSTGNSSTRKRCIYKDEKTERSARHRAGYPRSLLRPRRLLRRSARYREFGASIGSHRSKLFGRFLEDSLSLDHLGNRSLQGLQRHVPSAIEPPRCAFSASRALRLSRHGQTTQSTEAHPEASRPADSSATSATTVPWTPSSLPIDRARCSEASMGRAAQDCRQYAV